MDIAKELNLSASVFNYWPLTFKIQTQTIDKKLPVLTNHYPIVISLSINKVEKVNQVLVIESSKLSTSQN